MTKRRVALPFRFDTADDEQQVPPLRSPGFPVELDGVDALYAPFFAEGRTRGLVRAAWQEIRVRYGRDDTSSSGKWLFISRVGRRPLTPPIRYDYACVPVAFLIGHSSRLVAKVLRTLHGTLRVQGDWTMWVESQRPRRWYTGSSPMPRRHLSVIPAGTRPSLFGGD
jgi:hypothetical protein